MGKQKYNLNQGEKIVFKVSSVRHGFWGAYTDTLVITNQSIILEKYGLFMNFKGIERYNYLELNQVMLGESSNGEKQLEIYIKDKVEDFSLQSGDENELEILIMAINDQMGSDAEYYDSNYYNSIVKEEKDINRILELRAKAEDEDKDSLGGTGLAMIGSVSKNILKSGDISIGGVTKSINKAMGRQNKKGIFSAMKDSLLDDIGIRDLQDEFTEMGNEFREEFGLKTKMTHADRKELEELEEKQRKQQIKNEKKLLLQNKVEEQKMKIDAIKNPNREEKPEIKSATMTVNEQMDALKKAKELLDLGILTQLEFDQKKKEIMNNSNK